MAGLAPSLLAPSLLAPSQVPHQPLYGPAQPSRHTLRGPQSHRKAQQGPWQPPQPLTGLEWRRRGLAPGGLKSPSPPYMTPGYSSAGRPAAASKSQQRFKKRQKKAKEGKAPPALSSLPSLAGLGEAVSNLWPNPDKVEAADWNTNRCLTPHLTPHPSPLAPETTPYPPSIPNILYMFVYESSCGV